MTNQIKELSVQIRIRNNRLLKRRKELGVNQGTLAKMVGISTQIYRDFEMLKTKPISESGEWKDTALKLAVFFSVIPEDLFPPVSLKIKSCNKTVEIDSSEIPALSRNPDQFLLVEHSEISDNIKKALCTLTPREAKVIDMRFGLKGEKCDLSLDDVAEAFDVSRERIRQIEGKALRKLRQPRVHKVLKSFIDP
jgi:RNA polymerase sigma factor (sigma-70 family)